MINAIETYIFEWSGPEKLSKIRNSIYHEWAVVDDSNEQIKMQKTNIQKRQTDKKLSMQIKVFKWSEPEQYLIQAK